MKYIITSKNILENSIMTNPEIRTELCTELVMTRIKALQLLNAGIISKDDTIITRIDRKCLYENLFNNIMDWSEFESIISTINPNNIIDIPPLINSLCGVERNEHTLIYDDLKIKTEDLFNINLETKSHLNLSKPYICVIIRNKPNMQFLNFSLKYWNEFIEKIIEITKGELNVFIFGEFLEQKLDNQNIIYINNLQDWCLILGNNNCKLLVSTVCGAINPIFFTGHEESNLLLIDNNKCYTTYKNNPSFYGECINFKKVKIQVLEFKPTIDQLIEEILQYIKNH